MRFWFTLIGVSLVAVSAEDSLPVVPRVTERESSLAVVVAEKHEAMHYVGAHADALEIFLRSAARLGLPPGRKPRIEVADIPNLPPVACTVKGGQVLVAVRLGDATQAPSRASEAVARSWLAAASLAGSLPTNEPAPWAPPAIAAEVVAQLRPAMVDFWYRQATLNRPAALTEVVAGKAGPGESLLFIRALRRNLSAQAFGVTLAAAGRGEDILPTLLSFAKDPQLWWIASRQALLDARPPLALGMRESLSELDALARFVHDPVGLGDIVLDGPAAARLRKLPAVQEAMAARLVQLRKDILRQNPVAHNSWRCLGSWMEAFPTGTEKELDDLWQAFVYERQGAENLAQEVERAMGTIVR